MKTNEIDAATSSSQSSDVLPAPRLQLAWRKATDDEIKRNPIMQFGRERGDVAWACDYAIVIPLREHDIRREDEDGEDVRSEKIVVINTQLRGGSNKSVPCQHDPADAPYRDGAHARWDSVVLGGLPIYVIAPDGAAARIDQALERAGGGA